MAKSMGQRYGDYSVFAIPKEWDFVILINYILIMLEKELRALQ